MKKIHITESQFRHILGEDVGYPLNLKSDDGKPDNFTETEVAVNNNDKDAKNDVTIGINRTKEGWFGMNRYPAMQRIPESRELDNMENSGFGKNNDDYINQTASANGGKMASNIAGEINSNRKGSRNNTNQVRVSRMEDYKENNPELFAKNGGEKTLNILKGQTKKQSNTYGAKHATDIRTQNTTPGAQLNFDKGEKGAYYFK